MVGIYDNTTSDFLETLKQKRPGLLNTFHERLYKGASALDDRAWERPLASGSVSLAPQVEHLLEGTTILAAVYKDGVIIVGDRQATEGFQVGERRMQKVYEVDTYSAIAIAGVAGPCIEMAKLFQVQVEFYEKIEGTMLSLEGKANYLANMVRQNLGMAMQGLIVIPIFAGYDLKRKHGRIFKYDPAGGRYEEGDYYAIGSGGKDARSSLKKLYRSGMSRDELLNAVTEALWDAADEDLGTGGPDFLREIYPTIKVIDRTGISNVPDSEIKTLYTELFEKLKQ